MAYAGSALKTSETEIKVAAKQSETAMLTWSFTFYLDAQIGYTCSQTLSREIVVVLPSRRRCVRLPPSRLASLSCIAVLLLAVRSSIDEDASESDSCSAWSRSSEEPTCNLSSVVCRSKGCPLLPPSPSPSSSWLFGWVVVLLGVCFCIVLFYFVWICKVWY